MSSRKQKDPVTLEECDKRFNFIRGEVREIKEALIGKLPEGGGLVGEVKDIKNRLKQLNSSKLSGKEKAAIASSVIIAASSIAVAIIK